MRRVALYLFVAIATFALVLYVKNPELLNDIWLWIVGLFASIVALAKELIDRIKNGKPLAEVIAPNRTNRNSTDNFESTTIDWNSNELITDDQFRQLQKERLKQQSQISNGSANNRPNQPGAGNSLNESGTIKQETDQAEEKPSQVVITLKRSIGKGKKYTIGTLVLPNGFRCITMEGSGFDKDKIEDERLDAGTYFLSIDNRKDAIDKTYYNRGFSKDYFKGHIGIKNVPGRKRILLIAPIVNSVFGNELRGITTIELGDGSASTSSKKYKPKDSYARVYQYIIKQIRNKAIVQLKIED